MIKQFCLRRFAAFILLAALFPGTLYAQSAEWERHPYLDTKFLVSMGGFFSAASAKISVDGTLNPDNPEYDFGALVRVDESDSGPSG